MKRTTRLLLCLMLTSLFLSITAFADMGPKPQLTVRVENAPDELYYLDLLAKGAYDETDGFSGIEWSYHEREDTLDPVLLDALRAAVPEGWHACTAQGTNDLPMWGQLYAVQKDAVRALHVFSYHGVPEVYRILIVTESGETWISDTMKREVLQSSVTVDWDGADTSARTPGVAAGYVMQFFSTFVPTVLIEGVLLLLFGFKWKENRRVFLLTNLVTQGGLALYIAVTVMQHGVSGWSYILFVPIEIVITVTESLIYSKKLKGQGRSRAAAYGVCANLASALLGIGLAGPVWRFIVSIS